MVRKRRTPRELFHRFYGTVCRHWIVPLGILLFAAPSHAVLFNVEVIGRVTVPFDNNGNPVPVVNDPLFAPAGINDQFEIQFILDSTAPLSGSPSDPVSSVGAGAVTACGVRVNGGATFNCQGSGVTVSNTPVNITGDSVQMNFTLPGINSTDSSFITVRDPQGAVLSDSSFTGALDALAAGTLPSTFGEQSKIFGTVNLSNTPSGGSFNFDASTILVTGAGVPPVDYENLDAFGTLDIQQPVAVSGTSQNTRQINIIGGTDVLGNARDARLIVQNGGELTTTTDGTINLDNGVLQIENGGTHNNIGTINVNDGGVLDNAGVLNNIGPGGSDLIVAPGGTITNNGGVINSGASDLLISEGHFNNQEGTFNNEGSAFLAGTFDNTNGIVTNSSNGHLNLFGVVTNGPGGNIENNGNMTTFDGTFDIAAGSTVTGTGAVGVNGGSMNVDGTLTQQVVFLLDGALTGDGTINSDVEVQGGRFSGTQTINGDVVMTGGTLAPGNSPGTVNIAGSLQVFDGVIELEVDENGIADVIDADGGTFIGADVEFVITFGSIPGGGTFVDVEELFFADNAFIDLIDLLANVTVIFEDGVLGVNDIFVLGFGFDGLRFTGDGSDPVLVSSLLDPNDPVPEPDSLLLFGAGLLGMAAARRRRR